MKIIFGLGNPGKKYLNTRHNVGFSSVDYLLEAFSTDHVADNKFQSEIFDLKTSNDPSLIKKYGQVLFVKPQAFMNNSGGTIKELVDFYKLNAATDILVIHDEVDLPLGTIRSTESSSHAGQNGVRDTIESLGSQDFHRIRIGVETRASRDELPTDVFVLGKFTEEELEKIEKEILPNVRKEVEKFLND